MPLINISRKHAFCFAGFLVLYEFLTYIANDMIMPGMIHVVASFHGQESAIATSLTAYVLGGASLQLFLGPISDSIGRRPVMLTGAVLFVAFTLLIACSQSMEQFLIARFFEGMGLCFIGVIGYATIQEIFSEMAAIRIVALMSNVSQIAPLLGPLAGASFILYFNWRIIFLIIGGLGMITLAGLWYFMPESVGALKKDGERIPKVSLNLKVVGSNYWQLLCNPAFMLGCVAVGMLSIPCIAWIAISPIIIVTKAKLTVMDYALWQLPVFGSCIAGNWLLRLLTHIFTVKQLIQISCAILLGGLLLTYLLPLIWGEDFHLLMPGFLIYGLGIGVAGGPLNRYVLFATSVPKGTAYAVISMMSMAILAAGVEVGNWVYRSHNNEHFALYCAIVGILYLITLTAMLLCPPHPNQSTEKSP